MKNTLAALCLLLIYSFNPLQAQETTTNTSTQDKASYKGRKKQGMPHGYGRSTWPDGRKYEGYWDNGQMDGQGSMKYANGDSYEGEWKMGKKDGRGTYIWKNGDKYIGGYSKGKRQGWGSLRFANGDKYEGYWKNDEAFGQGLFVWANGDYYDGEWKNNLRDGNGVMVYKDGGIQQGSWKQGEYVPCDCDQKPSVEQALETADAVVTGRVIEVTPGKDKYSRTLIRLKVTEYWKGDLGVSGVLLLSTGRSSCDMIYFDGAEYLLFLNKSPFLSYVADKCSPSGDRFFKELEVQELNKLVPCQEEAAPSYLTEGVSQSVCGCDGKTYSSPKRAAANGVIRWTLGKCEEEK